MRHIIKLLIIGIFLLLTHHRVGAQYKFKLKEHVVPASSILIGGMFEGAMDFLQFHYDKHDGYWNPDYSWKNKYKNGDPSQGEAFFGSTTVFVAFTDGWHLMKMGRNIFTTGAILFHISTTQKKRWWVYIVEGAAYYIVNRIGFSITYNLLK